MPQAFLFDKFAAPTTAGTDIVEPDVVYHECSMKMLDENDNEVIEVSRKLSVKPVMAGKKDKMRKVFNVLDVAMFSTTDDELFPTENQFKTEQEAVDYLTSEVEFANFCKKNDVVWDGRRYLLKEVEGKLKIWHGEDDPISPQEERGLVLG